MGNALDYKTFNGHIGKGKGIFSQSPTQQKCGGQYNFGDRIKLLKYCSPMLN